MTPDPVRVALVGYGFAGRTFHAPLIRATPGMTLAVVVSGDAAKVQADIADTELVPTPAAAFERDDVESSSSPPRTTATRRWRWPRWSTESTSSWTSRSR